MASEPVFESYVRLFVGRHRRLFTIVGALLVFTTFVVNEAVKENVRESNDATSNTLQLYELESNFTEIRRELALIPKEIANPQGSGPITFPDLDALLLDIKPVLELLEKRDRINADDEYAKLHKKLTNLQKNYQLSLDELNRKLANLKDGIRKFASEVIEQAEKRQQERERQYFYCKVASYFMFALGWGLALASHLFGIEDLSTQ